MSLATVQGMEPYDQELEDREIPVVWFRTTCRHCGEPLFHPFGTDLHVATCEKCYQDQSPSEETG
jgi:RNase P subunit RPR2